MSSWSSLKIHFDPFAPLKPPLRATLSVLETVEAVLEALLAIIRAFLLDLLNPLKAIIAIILAAIRAIINQIKSAGFAILLVHPDFSQQDFAAVLNSVGGAYPGFESKVIGKFFDTSDIFRPTYPPGSAVAMFVFYIGADSPGDLLGQIFALLNLIKHPLTLTGLPAPVNLKARPVNKSGAAISQFRKLFDQHLDTALELEWSMPQAPSSANVFGFVNSLVSFYNSFRFPNFVVERSEHPSGSPVTLDVKTQTVGSIVSNLQDRFGFAAPESTTTVIEPNGSQYQNFEYKRALTGTDVLEGSLTGTYRYLDKLTEADRGKVFYYRVRAYFGNPSAYLATTDSASVSSQLNTLVFPDRNNYIIRYGQGVTMGNPSPVARGLVPIAFPSSGTFNIYQDVYRAIQAGILLNFEFPPAGQGDTAHQKDQKTGWGTLGMLGGVLGPLKSAYTDSNALRQAFLFNTASRRLANLVVSQCYTKPVFLNLLATKWTGGAKQVVDEMLGTPNSLGNSATSEGFQFTWKFVGITAGFTSGADKQAGVLGVPVPIQNGPNSSQTKINNYLAKEQSYSIGKAFDGPLPIDQKFAVQNLGVSVPDRQDLADFLQTALASMSSQSKYLQWYSVTIGDIFPAFIPFIFDFEQYILALLNAIKSALKEIEDIIETLIQKIQSLEAILRTLLSLLDLLNINVTVSVFATLSSNGSAASLATALQQSKNKPGSSPFGLHSGIVMTAGGPGQGAIAALKAIAFLFQIKI